MRDLTFSQTVPKALVHKWSIDQVLITDFEVTSDTQMRLSAQLPRAHSLYCENMTLRRNPDFAGLVEICRQACFVVAHEQFRIPLTGKSYQFLFQQLDATILMPPAEMNDAAEVLRPSHVIVECDIERQWKRGGDPSGLIWAFRIERDDRQELARVRIRQTWIERSKWRDMRRIMRRDRGLPSEAVLQIPGPSALAPMSVGRNNPDNVALSAIQRSRDGYDAIARVDIRHPVFFDHPIDHVYAMVQTEACRQLALYCVADRGLSKASELEISRCEAHFLSVAEFDMPLRLAARTIDRRPEEDTRIAITLLQNERKVSEFTIHIRPAFRKPAS